MIGTTITRFAAATSAILLSTAVHPLMAQQAGSSTESPAQPKVEVDPNGVVRVSSLAVPLSGFITPEAQKIEAAQLTAHGWPGPSGPITGPGPIIDNWRHEMDEKIFIPALERQKAVYPVTIEEKTIAGVKTDIVTPKDGIAPKNKNRVLINLHSGGFQMGAGAAALTESEIGRASCRERV